MAMRADRSRSRSLITGRISVLGKDPARLRRRGRAGRASPRLSPARGAPDAVPRSGAALIR